MMKSNCEHSQSAEDSVKIYNHFWENKVYGSVAYSLCDVICNLWEVLLELFAMIQITMKYFNYNLDFIFWGKKLKQTLKQQCLHTDLIVDI